MKLAILVYNSAAFAVNVPDDVSMDISDILLALEQGITDFYAIGDIKSSEGDKWSFANWEKPGKGKISFPGKTFHNKPVMVIVEHDHRAYMAQHSATWLKRAKSKIATLGDIAPDALKREEWHDIDITVKCANCGSDIKGHKRVKGKHSQKFKPVDEKVFNIGHRWFCECSSTTGKKEDPIPEAPVVPASIAVTTVSFTGTIAEIKAAMYAFLQEV